MDINYVTLLDYSTGSILIIKLDEKQKAMAENFDDFESYLYTLESLYGFRLKDCCWMGTFSYEERKFNF